MTAVRPEIHRKSDRGAARRSGGSSSLGRASGIMAIGTLLSRATGFVRTVAIVAALGVNPVSDAYNLANTTPNILYDLLLGGVLSSVIVPVLVRVSRDEEDGGEAFASSLLTLVVLGLGAAVLLGLVAAPWIIDLYSGSDASTRSLAVTFLRNFLPQVVFYGLGATVGAILNVRGRFGPPMITPVLNNLVVIAAACVFIFMPGPQPPTTTGITDSQILVIGGGTTLGVVVMTLALLPYLRAVGFRYRPRLDLRHPALRQAGRLAGWMLVFVAVNQVAYLIVARLATSSKSTYTAYTNAYQLFQLPHAIVAVSVITALLPRMSGHAAEGRDDLLRADLSRGMRLSYVAIVPASFGLLVLAKPISVAVFAHHNTTVHGATAIGSTLAAFAVAIVPFSTFQLLLRAFYARQDSRTPALVASALAATNIISAYALSAALPKGNRGVALASAFAISYVIGAVILIVLLRRQIGSLDGSRVLRLVARTTVAAGLAALIAGGLASLLRSSAGTGPAASLAAVVVGGGVGVIVYVVAASRMRVTELTSLLDMVRARIRH
jgi:putative peptidoglycan lipid II flippase